MRNISSRMISKPGLIRFSAALLCFSLSGGCATLLRGTHQTVKFDSVPQGATVDVAGKTFTTPSDVDMVRKKSYPVTVSKSGYQTMKFDMNPEWDGISLVGNMILPGGSVGIIYDATSGADQNFYELAKINLIPATQPSADVLVLHTFKGHLLTDEELARAVQADRNDRSQFFRGEP